MASKQAQQIQEIKKMFVHLDPIGRKAVVVFLLALQAGQDEREAFNAANAALERANRQPLSWEAYQSFP